LGAAVPGTGAGSLSPRALFDQVFREAQLRFVFTARALRLEDDRFSLYIKPADGLELPAIMKWLKQTFAQRHNRLTGRTGHIWGTGIGRRHWLGSLLRGAAAVILFYNSKTNCELLEPHKHIRYDESVYV
jgi:hypothetical protein